MRNSRPEPINKLFGNISEHTCRTTLSQVQKHAIFLLKLNRAVSALLPAPLRPWCRLANIRQNVIVLEISNASWLMQLRYEQHQLLSKLRAQILPSLSAIDIRINPAMAIKQESNAQK